MTNNGKILSVQDNTTNTNTFFISKPQQNESRKEYVMRWLTKVKTPQTVNGRALTCTTEHQHLVSYNTSSVSLQCWRIWTRSNPSPVTRDCVRTNISLYWVEQVKIRNVFHPEKRANLLKWINLITWLNLWNE